MSVTTTRPKYSQETKDVAKRARELRGRASAVAPVTVERAQAALGDRDPMDVLKGVKLADLKAYAAGSKEIKAPAGVVEISKTIDDPFARGRGFVAIALALAGK